MKVQTQIFDAITSVQTKTILESFFSEASAAQYIGAINCFVRQHIENATPSELSEVYNLMKLTETIAALEGVYRRLE